MNDLKKILETCNLLGETTRLIHRITQNDMLNKFKDIIMKKSVLFRIAVLVIIAFSGTTVLKAQEAKFVTNEEMVGELVVSKTIYRLEDYLYRHMKYDFTYDDQDRMVAKEAFKWDSWNEKWVPYFKIDYSYSSNEITLVYARWNESHKDYDAAAQKSIYELNDANMPIAYVNYKWNDAKWVKERNNNWAMNIQPQKVSKTDLLLVNK